MSDRHPEFLYGFNAGIQAAWEQAHAMAETLGTSPVTPGGKIMRDAALDISDAILALKQRAPGEPSLTTGEQPK